MHMSSDLAPAGVVGTARGLDPMCRLAPGNWKDWLRGNYCALLVPRQHPRSVRRLWCERAGGLARIDRSLQGAHPVATAPSGGEANCSRRSSSSCSSALLV